MMTRTRSVLAGAIFAALAACADPVPDTGAIDAGHDGSTQAATCKFESGRPCPPGTTCLGAQGNECNYYNCQGDRLEGTAIACGTATYPTPAVGPLVSCDPAELARHGTPPPGPCALGELHSITAAGGWGSCVSTRQCKPLACDPAWQGDGCPSFHTCDPATSLCALAPAP